MKSQDEEEKRNEKEKKFELDKKMLHNSFSHTTP
jgi:hypothetical protein